MRTNRLLLREMRRRVSLIDDMKIAGSARISKFHKRNDTIESGVSSAWYLDSRTQWVRFRIQTRYSRHGSDRRERVQFPSITNYKLRHYFDSQHSAWSYARSTVPSCNIDDPPRIKCPMIASTLTGILIAKRVRATDFQWMGSEFKLWLYPRVV